MSSQSDEPIKAIEGRARTVRELLDKAVGRVRRARQDAEIARRTRARRNPTSFYQREYAWQERQVRELIDDLTGKFLDHYEEGHERHEVERYGHYFLGLVLAPTLQRGSKDRCSSVAWMHWPLERLPCIPTLERGNESRDRRCGGVATRGRSAQRTLRELARRPAGHGRRSG
jgi:hypothetical protein